MSELILDHRNLAALARSLLAEGHVVRFSAPGYSMFPFIRNGDTIEVHPWGERQPRVMDVVFCLRPNDGVVVHRLVSVAQNNMHRGFLLCGDAPHCRGEWIDREQALGWVASVEHTGRRVRLDSGLMRALARLWTVSRPVSAYALRPGIILWLSLRRLRTRFS